MLQNPQKKKKRVFQICPGLCVTMADKGAPWGPAAQITCRVVHNMSCTTCQMHNMLNFDLSECLSTSLVQPLLHWQYADVLCYCDLWPKPDLIPLSMEKA